MSELERKAVPETHRVWLNYRSEKYFGPGRTKKGTGYGKAPTQKAKPAKMKPVPDHAVGQITLPTPCGSLVILASKKGLVGAFYRDRVEPTQLPRKDEGNKLLREAREQLEEYLDGKRLKFDLPLDARGSAFQKKVWRELLQIPFGQTTTYGEIAERINQDGASRAVGLANGSNPLSIIVPCHRVIGANGKLTGYAGGLERKIWLLDHEVRVLAKGANNQK